MKLYFKIILRFEQISSTVTKMSLRQKCGCLRSSGSSDLGFCDMSVELRCLDLTGSNVQGLNVEVDSILTPKLSKYPFKNVIMAYKKKAFLFRIERMPKRMMKDS